jgi:hypothetical protein
MFAPFRYFYCIELADFFRITNHPVAGLNWPVSAADSENAVNVSFNQPDPAFTRVFDPER